VKNFPNDTIQEFVFRNQYYSNYFCGYYIEYQDDLGVWRVLRDVLDFSFQRRSDNEETTVYQLMPTADTLSFRVFNLRNKYTIGAGGQYDGVIATDRLCRLKLFWRIPEILDQSSEETDQLVGAEMYHTKKSGSDIILDIASAAASPQFFPDLNLYGSETYGDSTYEIPGYYVTEAVSTDNIFLKTWQDIEWKELKVTKAGSGKITMRYRTKINNTWGAWSIETELSTGINIIDIVDIEAEKIQMAFFWYSSTWNSTDKISDIAFVYGKTAEEFDFGTFYMQTPTWPNTEQNPTINVSCFNIAKKILDKKKITTKYYNTNVLISTFIKETLEIAGLTSTEYDIATTTATIRNPTIYTDAPLADILEDCLNKLQIENDYRLFMKDDKITLAIVETDREADYVLDDRFHSFSLNRIDDAANQASFVTVFSDENTLPKSGAVVGEVDLISAPATGSAAGDVTITNFKTSPVNHYPAVNIRTEIVTTGNFEVTEVYRKVHNASPEMKFTVTGTSGTYSINVRGVVLLSPVGFMSEDAGDGLNQRNATGKQLRYVNPLIDNDADANSLAQFIFDYNSDKKIRIDGQCLPIPQLDLNDNLTLVSLRLQETNIYVLSSMSFRGDSVNGVKPMSFEMIDTLQDIADIVYDRNGYRSGINDINYDLGFVYDQDIFNQGIDNSIYIPKIKV